MTLHTRGIKNKPGSEKYLKPAVMGSLVKREIADAEVTALPGKLLRVRTVFAEVV